MSESSPAVGLVLEVGRGAAEIDAVVALAGPTACSPNSSGLFRISSTAATRAMRRSTGSTGSRSAWPLMSWRS